MGVPLKFAIPFLASGRSWRSVILAFRVLQYCEAMYLPIQWQLSIVLEAVVVRIAKQRE
jgi:hypothetical protein